MICKRSEDTCTAYPVSGYDPTGTLDVIIVCANKYKTNKLLVQKEMQKKKVKNGNLSFTSKPAITN